MKLFLDFARRYVSRYVWWYIGGILCILLTQTLMISIVELTKRAIDAYTVGGATAATVLPYALAIAIIAPLLVLIRTASRLLIFTPGRLSEYHIRNDYYSSLLYLQRDFFSNHETGDLVSRCTNDIGFIRGAFGFGFLQVANVTITLFSVMAAMYHMDGRATLYIAIPMVLSFIIIQASIHYMFSHWRIANIQLGDLSSLCLASYKGVSAVQNYHAEPSLEARFNDINDAYLHTSEVITRTRSYAIPLVQLVGFVSMFLVLWFIGPEVINGRMTMGEISAFIGYVSMVMPPLLSLGWTLNVFNRALPAIERLSEILDAVPNVPEPVAGTFEKIQGKPHLEAKNLGCRFPETRNGDGGFRLQDICFDLPPGKVLGIVGPVASGKTALLDTLLRLNHLEAGTLFINGQDATFLDLRDFRRFFSFTPQKALLFSTSLRKNLETALPELAADQTHDETRMLHALHSASFRLDPKQFPQGLETQVGEKGVMLSGGQRQRIALARALLKEADIYVLDDVLSAVDHDTEKEIIANLRQFAPGKSFIIASHRVSAIQWADEILVLDDGRIIDRGSHGDLINKPGFYRDIYQYQAQQPQPEVAS